MTKPLCKRCKRPIYPTILYSLHHRHYDLEIWHHNHNHNELCNTNFATPYAKDVRALEQERLANTYERTDRDRSPTY